MSDHPKQGPANPDEPDEPDFAAILASLLGAVDNPEVAEALAAMGIDKKDPATMAIVGAQLKSMLSGGSDEPFNVELANDVARKSVATSGDSVIGAVARREIEQAVEVANIWVDAVTDLPAPAGAVHAWSRAEWDDLDLHERARESRRPGGPVDRRPIDNLVRAQLRKTERKTDAREKNLAYLGGLNG